MNKKLIAFFLSLVLIISSGHIFGMSGKSEMISPDLGELEGQLIDDFSDGDNNALNGWGLWVAANGGPNNDSSGQLIMNAPGVEGKAAKYTYVCDSGDCAYNHIGLDFGRAIDLHATAIESITFWIKGPGGAEVKFIAYSSLSGDANGYGSYKKNLGRLSREWQKVTIHFKELQWEGDNQNYTLEEALKSCTSFKWEVGDRSAAGSIFLDHVSIVNDGTAAGFAQEYKYETPEYEKETDIAWELIWSDEFDYQGLPDPQKWNFEDQRPGWVNNELQNYPGVRKENARVENGFLIIEARKDNYKGHPYSSARIHTQGKGEILYGRAEIRAKLPSGRGTWPAIWMMPSDYYGYGKGWPDSGEIDIMENVGKDPNWVHASVHCQNYYWVKGNQHTEKIYSTSYQNDFHVYALEWYPERIDIFMDGQKYFTFNDPGEGWQGWPFDKNFYVILNLAVGGHWGGPVDDSIFPQQMVVDYVRLYKHPGE